MIGTLPMIDQNNFFSFFAVLTRLSVLFSVYPIFGDRSIPAPVKILLSLCMTFSLYPVLVKSGAIIPSEAAIWSTTTVGLVGTLTSEILFALALAFTAKLTFEAVQLGGDMLGQYMGLSSASMYDPHQESQSGVVAHLQMAFCTLLFLSVQGHHVLIRAISESYSAVHIGGAVMGEAFQAQLIRASKESIWLGLQFAMPMAAASLLVNVTYGVVAKAIPQTNIMALSLAVGCFVGLIVLFLGQSEFQVAMLEILARLPNELRKMMEVMSGR